PLGIAAAIVLTWLMWRWAPRLRPHPRLVWLATAASLTMLATAASAFGPPLIGALLAALAIAASLAAWLPAGVARLPLVGLLVLAGNTVRNAVLVALEARPQVLSAGMHEAIGLIALLAVCVPIVRLMHGEAANANVA